MCCGSGGQLSIKRIVCPNCGKKIAEIGTIKVEKCPYCNMELSAKASNVE
jgi:uncharacterized CHY-type Zn-finger protein